MMATQLSAIPRPIPTNGLPKMPTTITATTTSSTNSNTKLSSTKLPCPKSLPQMQSNSPPDPNKPIINPITNRKSYDHITDRELRKKLKNRESAQAARDRKKAKMLTLERQLADMAERNKLLENENRDLRGRIQRMEAEAFWRLVKNPADGTAMEVNPMAGMMNPAMHPSAMAHNMNIPAMNMDTTPAHSQPSQSDVHQIQISEQHKHYQRQMQFLLEGNPAVAAAFHGQINSSAGNMTPMSQASTEHSPKTISSDSDTIELAHINFPSLRLPTKGEPIDHDDDHLTSDLDHDTDIPSEALGGNSDGLDDWILRNFKGEASPISGKTGSTGYSSAGCESPEGTNGAPSSPEFSATVPWTNNRIDRASSDSGHFSERTFSAETFNPKFPFNVKTDKIQN